MIDVAGRSVPFISVDDLKANKVAPGRLQDLADVEALKRGESSSSADATGAERSDS